MKRKGRHKEGVLFTLLQALLTGLALLLTFTLALLAKSVTVAAMTLFSVVLNLMSREKIWAMMVLMVALA